ncbi:UNVERIFIED_CONTAM: hypothetical protein PYX00_011414 [Menopon gallinae]|uniref:Uncharacterized protein n=1 Tax=Menopon gallinae TaxID=328185 RepID=A0AAW2H7G2_9NEOP
MLCARTADTEGCVSSFQETAGQAIKLNAMAMTSLCHVYETNIGPFGTLKMLITPSGTIKTTKDGSVLSREIQFSHPTAIVVTRLTKSLAAEVGDGTSSFVVLCCRTFLNGFRYFNDGASLHRIVETLEGAKTVLVDHLRSEARPLEEGMLEKIAFASLCTKVEAGVAGRLAAIVVDALRNIQGARFFDTNMVEVMKMGEGDIRETRLVEGLVLDHAGRHMSMPRRLENVAILITNMSLEYEKPEINSTFYYSTAEQREKMVESEKAFILERAQAVARFARKLREERGKNLVVISERGIDPFSLEVLAAEGVLALRRAKRRNMERLVKMCGGSLVSTVGDLDTKNLGFCSRVTVHTVGEDKYTFVEGTPFKESCTILVRGSSDAEMERTVGAIRSTLTSVSHAMRDRVFINGGIQLYYSLSRLMDTKARESSANVGFRILRDTYLDMAKVLVRNSGRNVEEEIGRMESGTYKHEDVPENLCVVMRVLVNSCTAAMNLLLVDEIIKAGKSMKEERQQG